VEVVVDSVAGAAEEASGSDVGGASAEDVSGVVGKAFAPLGIIGALEAERSDEEFLQGFVVFVGAFVVSPFVEGFFEEPVAEGFGVEDGVGVEDEPASVLGQDGAGTERLDFAPADEERLLEEATPHVRSRMCWGVRIVSSWSG
jgi:hypothetical protein